MIRVLSLATLLLSAGSGEPSHPVGGMEAQEDPVYEAALQFSQLWVDRDGVSLERMMRGDGIRLQLTGEDHPSLSPRKARASLLSFMTRYTEGEIAVIRASQVGDDAVEGATELHWRCVVSGSSQPVIFTLFVVFVRENTKWAVSEIRILP